MKVLVTGATGYVGAHVVETLIELGQEVIAVDISDGFTDKRAKFIKYDIFSGDEDVFHKLGEPECLIHLAWKDGFMHNAMSHIEFLPKHYKFIKTMIESGTKNINVMGSMHEIGYFVGAIDENTPQNPMSLYGISKNALRQALLGLCLTSPFELKWLRGFYILGDDKRNNSIFTKILQKAEQGEKEFPFTTGENQYDFISVENLALEIALASLQQEICGVINCSTGKPVALKDKVESFIKEKGLDITLKYGVFPERPYDSKQVYGDNKKILKIIKTASKMYNERAEQKIDDLIKKLS